MSSKLGRVSLKKFGVPGGSMKLKLDKTFGFEGLPRTTRLSRVASRIMLVDAAIISIAVAVWRTVVDGFAAYAQSEFANHLDLQAHEAIEAMEEAVLSEKARPPFSSYFKDPLEGVRRMDTHGPR
jgi:hypothetical protein